MKSFLVFIYYSTIVNEFVAALQSVEMYNIWRVLKIRVISGIYHLVTFHSLEFSYI